MKCIKCEKCDRQIGIIVKQFDKNATTQGIEGFKCVECNEMSYMCQICFYKWYHTMSSQFLTEDFYQLLVRDIHFTKCHSSVDLI